MSTSLKAITPQLSPRSRSRTPRWALAFSITAPLVQVVWLLAQPGDGWRWDNRGERYVVRGHQAAGLSPLQQATS